MADKECLPHFLALTRQENGPRSVSKSTAFFSLSPPLGRSAVMSIQLPPRECKLSTRQWPTAGRSTLLPFGSPNVGFSLGKASKTMADIFTLPTALWFVGEVLRV